MWRKMKNSKPWLYEAVEWAILGNGGRVRNVGSKEGVRAMRMKTKLLGPFRLSYGQTRWNEKTVCFGGGKAYDRIRQEWFYFIGLKKSCRRLERDGSRKRSARRSPLRLRNWPEAEKRFCVRA